MNDCLFCKIVKKEIPAQIAYADDDFTAFSDIHPQAPVHILVVPNAHVADLISVNEFEKYGKLMQVVKTLAEKFDLHKEGFRVVMNNGKKAGQAVFHLHFHLLGGREFSWPPG